MPPEHYKFFLQVGNLVDALRVFRSTRFAAASFRAELTRDCRSATMIPPFFTLPSAAKICSSMYAMFVPPARLGQRQLCNGWGAQRATDDHGGLHACNGCYAAEGHRRSRPHFNLSIKKKDIPEKWAWPFLCLQSLHTKLTQIIIS